MDEIYGEKQSDFGVDEADVLYLKAKHKTANIDMTDIYASKDEEEDSAASFVDEVPFEVHRVLKASPASKQKPNDVSGVNSYYSADAASLLGDSEPRIDSIYERKPSSFNMQDNSLSNSQVDSRVTSVRLDMTDIYKANEEESSELNTLEVAPHDIFSSSPSKFVNPALLKKQKTETLTEVTSIYNKEGSDNVSYNTNALRDKMLSESAAKKAAAGTPGGEEISLDTIYDYNSPFTQTNELRNPTFSDKHASMTLGSIYDNTTESPMLTPFVNTMNRLNQNQDLDATAIIEDLSDVYGTQSPMVSDSTENPIGRSGGIATRESAKSDASSDGSPVAKNLTFGEDESIKLSYDSGEERSGRKAAAASESEGGGGGSVSFEGVNPIRRGTKTKIPFEMHALTTDSQDESQYNNSLACSAESQVVHDSAEPISLLDFHVTDDHPSEVEGAASSRSDRSGSVTRVPFSPVKDGETANGNEEEDDEVITAAPNSLGSIVSEDRAPPTPERIQCLLICDPPTGVSNLTTPPTRSPVQGNDDAMGSLDEFGVSPSNTRNTEGEDARRIKHLSRQLREQQTRARDLAQSNPVTTKSREPSFLQRIFCGLF